MPSLGSFGRTLLIVAALSAGVTAVGMRLLGGVASGNADEPVIVGQASVIDGDTIEIHGRRIRFYGIDAPEGRQRCNTAGGNAYRCGQKASLALSDRIGRQTVTCARKDVDRYGRIVAVCAAGGQDLNAWMVTEGWAVAYRRYSTAYVPDEEAAKAAKRGIWAGGFELPENWRREHSRGATGTRWLPTTKRAGCVIKGNISHYTGEKIYHVPGGKYYDSTVISPWRGERWFCTEAEARAAGWRRSKQ